MSSTYKKIKAIIFLNLLADGFKVYRIFQPLLRVLRIFHYKNTENPKSWKILACLRLSTLIF